MVKLKLKLTFLMGFLVVSRMLITPHHRVKWHII